MTQEYKKCNKCECLQPIGWFAKEPLKNHPEYRRKTCKVCRNKQRRDKNKETDYYKKQYASMSEKDRKEYIKKKSKQNSARKGIKKYRDTYNKSDRGIYSRYKGDCNRRGRKEREIQMLLKFEEFQLLINDRCCYCGKENCRGVDRIDSNESYTIENSKPCCKICNQMKNDLSEEEFLSHIKNILANLSN